MKQIINHLGLVVALCLIVTFAFLGTMFVFNRDKLNKTFKVEPLTWKGKDLVYHNGDINVYQFTYKGAVCLLADKYNQSPAVHCVGVISKPTIINPLSQ